MLRRGSSSKKEGDKQDVTDKKAAKLKAAEEKAAAKKAAKEKAAADKAAKKEAKAKGKDKSAKKEKPAKKPAVTGAPRGVLVRRPKTSIYSVMLGIAAGALTLGCLMLILEIWTYGAPWTFPWNIPINFK